MERAMYSLEQKDMPTHWYNLLPDLPEPLPPVLHPATGNPVTPDDLAPLFPMRLPDTRIVVSRFVRTIAPLPFLVVSIFQQFPFQHISYFPALPE